MAMLLISVYSFAVYKVGDLVTDFNFQDTNLENGNIVTYDHNLTDMIGTQEKVLCMNFFYPT